MKKIFFVILFLPAIQFVSHGQSIDRFVIGSTGNFIENSAMSLSSTTGEAVVETFTKTNNTLTQGFQQPDDIATGIEEVLSSGESISLFPNPVTDYVVLDITSAESVNYNIELTDLLGRRVETYSILHHENDKTRFVVDMQSLPSAIYILHLTSDKKTADHSFKVLKINF